MADQVKQLAFKSFTTSELQNGTAANVVTTDATTHYVIKSIESTQSGSSPVTATATIGLTSGLATDQYTTLGTLKQNRLGLSGSAIMDASSTLTIRPTATPIVYSDETVFQGLTSSTTSQRYVRGVRPSINGLAETALNSETSIDRSSVSYAGGSYNSMSPYPSSNYTIEHTNANGVDLRIVFGNGSSNGAFFEVWNADGTYYGYYNSSYDTPLFDGERYIFWVGTNGASNTRVFWYDLDESTTNLLAANTTGGGNSTNFWHGQTAVWADSPAINSRTTYDNHLNAFYKNRHTNGKRYITGWSRGNFKCWICELPDTLTNDSSTTPAPKWLYLNHGSQHSSGTDPFGNNAGSAWNMDRVFASGMYPTDQSQYRLTFDNEKARYYLWYSYNNHYWVCFTWTQAEFDARNSGNMFDPSGQGYALYMVATASFSDVNLDGNVFINWSSGNGYIDLQGSVFNNATGGGYLPFSNGAVYMDGKFWYYKNNGSSSGLYRKCQKVDMSSVSAASVTNMLPNTTVTATYNPDLFVGFGTPSATTIASRTYANAPSFKVRITGILSDQ